MFFVNYHCVHERATMQIPPHLIANTFLWLALLDGISSTSEKSQLALANVAMALYEDLPNIWSLFGLSNVTYTMDN